MSEYSYGRPEESYKPERASVDSIKRFLESWVEKPTGKDPMISRFAEAGIYLLEAAELGDSDPDYDPRFKNLLSEVIDYRNTIKKPDDPLLDADYAANILLRDIQFQFLSLDKLTRQDMLLPDQEPFTYPDERFFTTQGWIYGIKRILEERLDMLEGTLYFEKIISNVADRYKALKIIWPRYEYRFEGRPTNWLDVGPSIGLGPEKIILNERFNPVTASINTPIEHSVGEHSDILSAAMNSQINERKIEFEKVVGFDTTISNNHILRVKAHSFYPIELYEYSKPHDEKEEPNRLDEFNRLAGRKVEGYHSHQGDFTSDQDITRFQKEYPGLKFDLITFFTVLYMFSDKEIMAAIENAKKLLSPEGIIFISDKAKPDPTTPSGLRVGGSWSDEWIYTGTIIDPLEGDLTPREVIRWKTARCNEVQLIRSW
jgi:SAM-dependent methyltransferase